MILRMPQTDDPHRERKERFLHLLEPVHDNLARFARSLARDEEETRDLVGETVLRALEAFDDLSDRRAFLSWLFTIAVRLHRRRVKRGELWGAYDESDVARRTSPQASPETRHDVAILYDAIARLKESEREAILLFEIAGLSLIEIREVQGGTLSGVKSRLARGRRKLARMLGVTDEVRSEGNESVERNGFEIERTRPADATDAPLGEGMATTAIIYR
jgi:RNA polymerase sigma-70 factor (ECF subfamily)